MGKKILIVDDASMIRNLVYKTATAAGYEVITADDGREGLKALQEHENIDIVYSDVNMPKMGGLDMVKLIRQNPKYEFLPIVMLTTERRDDLVKIAKELGVRAWLVKPFNAQKFLLTLEKLVG